VFSTLTVWLPHNPARSPPFRLPRSTHYDADRRYKRRRQRRAQSLACALTFRERPSGLFPTPYSVLARLPRPNKSSSPAFSSRTLCRFSFCALASLILFPLRGFFVYDERDFRGKIAQFVFKTKISFTSSRSVFLWVPGCQIGKISLSLF
jgi:hypothetical protein